MPFRYVAAGGEAAVEQALSFLGEIGPASRVVSELPESGENGAVQGMRGLIERHFKGDTVEFPGCRMDMVGEGRCGGRA